MSYHTSATELLNNSLSIDNIIFDSGSRIKVAILYEDHVTNLRRARRQ